MCQSSKDQWAKEQLLITIQIMEWIYIAIFCILFVLTYLDLFGWKITEIFFLTLPISFFLLPCDLCDQGIVVQELVIFLHSYNVYFHHIRRYAHHFKPLTPVHIFVKHEKLDTSHEGEYGANIMFNVNSDITYWFYHK